MGRIRRRVRAVSLGIVVQVHSKFLEVHKPLMGQWLGRMSPAPALALALSFGTMGCAQPEDSSPEPFWNLLRDGVEVGAASIQNLSSIEPQPVPRGARPGGRW